MTNKIEEFDYNKEIEIDSTPQEKLTSIDAKLVEHVSVEMTVEVGTANISIAELFKLKTGKKITLNEELDTPVKLLINNEVIAYGKLVAIQDRFGIEIIKTSMD